MTSLLHTYYYTDNEFHDNETTALCRHDAAKVYSTWGVKGCQCALCIEEGGFHCTNLHATQFMW